MMTEKIKVVELFAGVGGFRIGLEGLPRKEDSAFEVVWSNQWEPSTKKQHASLVYQSKWPKCNHSNRNIEEVIESDFDSIPNHDLLVGGFPCQDYSVATSLRNSKGLRGKKGVLWWSIEAILRKKGKQAPRFIMLENVDRLLKSPASQRGRDFAIMLRSLSDLGYAIEWRVVNAAEYGMPQRRKRIFILGYKKGSAPYERLKASKPEDIILNNGLFARAFPVKPKGKINQDRLADDVLEISNSFNLNGKKSPFLNSGFMMNGVYHCIETLAHYTGKSSVLGEVLQELEEVPPSFYIEKKDLEAWRWHKGAKQIQRVSRDGHPYSYSEGKMSFPDALTRASRTIVTGEGGSTPSRFKHVIQQETVFRRLTPVELERLNQFPDNHTLLPGVSDQKRAFFMGNALVCGVVERLGYVLAQSTR